MYNVQIRNEHLVSRSPEQVKYRNVHLVSGATEYVKYRNAHYIPVLSTLLTKVVGYNLAHGEVYSIQHYVIKFVSVLREVGGFYLVSFTDKTD